MITIKSDNEFHRNIIKHNLKPHSKIYKPTFIKLYNTHSLESFMEQISQLCKVNYQFPNIDLTLQLQQMMEFINTSSINNINSMLKSISEIALESITSFANLDLDMLLKSFSTELGNSIYSFSDSLKEFCDKTNLVENDIEDSVTYIDSTKEIFENNKLSKSDIINIVNIVVTLLFFVYGIFSETQNDIAHSNMTKIIEQNTEVNINLTKELEKLHSTLKTIYSDD